MILLENYENKYEFNQNEMQKYYQRQLMSGIHRYEIETHFILEMKKCAQIFNQKYCGCITVKTSIWHKLVEIIVNYIIFAFTA